MRHTTFDGVDRPKTPTIVRRLASMENAPERRPARVTPRTVLFVLAGLVLAASAVAALRYVFRTSIVVDGERFFSLWDDAMISMRYARNLAAGHGLVWNAGGEAVQGYSNLGLTLVMALLHLIPVGPAKAPLLFQLVSLGAAGVTVYFTAKLAQLLTGDRAAGVAAAVVVGTFAPFVIWSAQGADSSAIALCMRGLPSGKVDRRAFFAAAAGIVIRLDFALFYCLILAFAVWSASNRREVLLWGVGLLFGTVGALLLFGQMYYGDPLPNTFYLKASGAPRDLMIKHGWWGLQQQTSGRFGIALLLAALFIPLLWRRGRPFVLLYALLLPMRTK
jgi:arabinofuranosyltransferase